MSNNKLDNKNKLIHSIVYKKKFKKFTNYSLYKGRIAHRIELLDEKINDKKKRIQELNLNIANDNLLYKKYERELLEYKKEMEEISSLYAIKKADFQIIGKAEMINDNNEYFGRICEINNQMEETKMYMHNLELAIINSFKNKEDINKNIKKLKKRISILEYYLDYLYSEYEYMKLYTRSKTSKKKVIK